MCVCVCVCVCVCAPCDCVQGRHVWNEHLRWRQSTSPGHWNRRLKRPFFTSLCQRYADLSVATSPWPPLRVSLKHCITLQWVGHHWHAGMRKPQQNKTACRPMWQIAIQFCSILSVGHKQYAVQHVCVCVRLCVCLCVWGGGWEGGSVFVFFHGK